MRFQMFRRTFSLISLMLAACAVTPSVLALGESAYISYEKSEGGLRLADKGGLAIGRNPCATLQKIIVNTGGLEPGYLGPEESRKH